MKKKEDEIMSRIMKRANEFVVPSYVKREIGLSDDWQNKISPKNKKMVVQVACRLKSTLKKLSKN